MMKKSLKISKKVLSVVLSVLMVMSVFVFAPAASAAEKLPETTFQFIFKCDDAVALDRNLSDYPTVYSIRNLEKLILTVEYEDGTSENINLIYDDKDGGKTVVNETFTILHEKWQIGKASTTFTRKSTSKVKAVRLNQNLSIRYTFGSLGYSLTVKANGNTLGSWNKGTESDVNNKYIIGGDSGNNVAQSTATAIKFTQNPTSATVSGGSVSAQFKAVVVDQFGVAMNGNVTYAINPTNGAAIDKNSGVAVFYNKAPQLSYNRNSYVVTASKTGLKAVTSTIYITNERFDVTFNYIDKDGNDKSTTVHNVYYSTAATAPTDYAQKISTADGHKSFTGWDKTFNSVTSNLTVNAVYGEEEAHNFVSKSDVAVSGDKATGYTVADSETFECTVGKETKTEPVVLTEEFNAAASAASAILDESEKYNTESAAYKALESAYNELVGLVGNSWSSAVIKEKIDAVNAAVEAFKKALEEDPEKNYKEYTLTYIVDGVSESENYYFGQSIAKKPDPKKDGYNFAGWNLEIPETMPANDVTVTATWKTVDYTGYLNGIRGVNDGKFTISYTVEDKLEELIADANAAVPEDKKSFVANKDDEGYELDYTYTLTGWTPEKGAGVAADQTFTAVYTKGDFNYANYVEWDAAVADATEKILNSEKYSDESKQAVKDIIDSILRDQGVSYQPVIDAAVKNLNAKVKEIEDNAPASYKKLNVSFDLNGGVAAPAIVAQKVYYGEKATVPVVVPTKLGYDFAGWDFDFETAITEDTVVKAKWSVATYNVTFVDENGETVSTATFNYINAETGSANNIDVIKALAPAVPSKEGFTGYWNWDKVTFTAADLVVEPTYAANTYKVNFYQFKTDKAPYATVEYTFGATSIEEPAFPERDGYRGSWGSYVLGASDSNVYAEYSPITYTATFYDENRNVVDTRTYTIESTSVVNPAVPEKDGYTVTWPEWYTPNMIGNKEVEAVYTPRNDISVVVTMKSESGKPLGTKTIENQTMDSTIFVVGDDFAGYKTPAAASYKIKASGNAVELVYALNTYTATFVAEGKTVGEYNFNVETAKDTIAKAVAVPSKEGYTGAWKDFDVKAEDITIEATYDTVDYIATFVDDNGTKEVKFTVENTVEDVLVKAGAPAARDYYTVKWADFAIVAGNFTVNAIYTPVDYTANFVDENGVSQGTVTFNVETKSVINPPVPSKDGYTVTWPNWFTPGMHGDTTVEAVYTANKYIATFNDENDVFVGSVEYTVEDSVEEILKKAPAVPSKIGYEPGEWVLDAVVSGGMTIKPVYKTLTVYTATFYKLDGSVAKVVPFTIENTAADIMAQAPEVETVPGYVTSWTTVTVDKTAPKNLTINTQKKTVTYTATFVFMKDGAVTDSTSFKYTVESDKAALAASIATPADYMNGDYKFSFTGWDKEFDLYVGDTTYTAQYDEGTFVPANYTEFDKAVERAKDIVKNNDLTQEVIDKINELISDGYKKDGSDYGITDQTKVDEATKALNDYLDSLDKNGDGKVDDDNLKHYAIRFFSEGKQIGETQSLVKGATVDAPAAPTKAADEHHTYKFAGWTPAVTAVNGDQDYTATYTTVDYTAYDELLDDIAGEDLTDEVKDAIKEITDVIDANRDKAPLDPNTQKDVDKAVEEIKKLLDKDGDNEIDEDNYKHYTVKFTFKDKNAADITDDSNKNLRKGAKVTVPTIEESFEVKTADSDKTYVFTGWDKTVEKTVNGNADYTAQYKVVEYKDFNDIVDKVEDIDLNDETKKEIEEIIKGIEDKKNDEDGDKNTQEDVDKAVEEIKKILDSDGDGKVDDDVLKKYTVTFKWNGGEASQTVVSGKAAVAPATPAGYFDNVKHYNFDKWDKDFSAVKSVLEVNAVYTGEAHSFKSVLTTRPEAKKGATGVVTYTCNCGYSYTVDVNRADYDKYEAVRAELEEILKNVDLTDASRTEIEKVLKDNDIPRNYVDSKENGVDEQPLVDKATETLEAFLNDLKEKIEKEDEEVVKHYTVTFNWHGDSKTFKVVKGTKITAPTVDDYFYGGFNYRFLGWDKKVETVVSADATYTAQYTQPRSMDDVIEAEKKADEIIGNDDYYKDDQKKVEDAKKELDDYLEDVGVDLDNGQNPIEKGSKEDAKITELVEKLNNAIDSANKNKAEREKNNKNTSGFLGWLVRLLILVRHLLGMTA